MEHIQEHLSNIHVDMDVTCTRQICAKSQFLWSA